MKAPLTLTLVMYDITHDRTLQKVAKLLQKHGYERINYSVWLGWNIFADDTALHKEIQQLLRNPLAEGSRFYAMPLKAHTLAKMRSITGHKPTELEYWLGERKILFL
jgi:CRISPR-associated endonuclease Cas2